MTNLRRKFKGKLNQKQNVPFTINGLLGNTSGVVNVPNRNNYVYVRLAGSGVAEVFNNRVQTIFDLPVICGYDPVDPQRFQVLSIQGAMSDAVGSSIIYGTGYAPSERYRWMYPGGGQDPLFSELRQFMPLRITPVSSMSFVVHNQVIWNGTAWEIFGGSTEINLTSLIPTTSGKCAMVLISIDGDGAIETTKGTEVDIADLVVTDIPSPPAGTRYVIGAIRVYYGQTQIQEARTNTDIVDLRFPQLITDKYIDGIEVDLSTIADGNALIYDAYTGHIIPGEGGGASAIADLTDVDLTGISDDDILVYDLATETWLPETPATPSSALADLTDVDLTDLADGDVLVYDETSGDWLPNADVTKTIAGDWSGFIDGTLIVITNGSGTFIVPRDCTISKVLIHCTDTGSAGSTIVDVNLNGTTIFTAPADRPELAYDDVDKVAASGTPSVTDLTVGDILTLDIDQVATGAEGLSFIVAMEVTVPSSSPAGADILEVMVFT